ncbi:putative ribonuclease H-like domain-containing protein [Tanacetum coccineum]
MDVKSAFLYGTIEEEVYVCQPPGFEDPQFPDKVYKVERKSCYMTLFIKKDKGDILLVQVYVDDIIFGSTKKSLCDEFEGLMHKRFQMSSMGELTFFLGLQVQQKKDGIFISQDKYVADILKKFDFATVKTASTPMEPNKALIKDEEADSVDVHLYRSMIGSLMYLTASRPRHIVYLFVACACVQVTPKMSHLHAVKRIFRYLKGQPKLGLWYPRDSPFDLEAFSNSDYAGASLDRKSTTGEYVAAANCYGQVLRNHRSERVLEKPNEPPLPEGHTSGSGEGSMEHTFELMDTVPPTPHDSPLTGGYTPRSDEGRLKLKELMAICTKLSKQVLDLEKEKDAQAVEILKLKQRVKKLERKRKSSISHLRRRIYRQVESSDDDLDEEDASKQGRESDKTKSMFQDSDFDVLDDDMEDVEGETVHTVTTGVSALVTTDGVAISTAEPRTPPTTAATAFIDEDLTIAQTLIKMKEEKAKEKGVAIKDVEDSPRPIRSITTLQPLPTIDPKDKGKGVLVEEEPEKPEKVKNKGLRVRSN